MNEGDEVKHYLIFHIDYQETINNKTAHVRTSTASPYSRFTYPYIASPTESDLVIAKIVNIRFLPDEREYGDDFC